MSRGSKLRSMQGRHSWSASSCLKPRAGAGRSNRHRGTSSGPTVRRKYGSQCCVLWLAAAQLRRALPCGWHTVPDPARAATDLGVRIHQAALAHLAGEVACCGRGLAGKGNSRYGCTVVRTHTRGDGSDGRGG